MVKKLPDDLISDILSRLPVKPVLRFRCVSKTWCALIDNKHFVKKHLNRSLLTKSKHTLSLYQFPLHSLCSVLNLFSPQPQQHSLPPHLVHSACSVTIHFGSCNGLHCVILHKHSGDAAVVWNPATRKHVEIPKFSFENPFTQDGSFDPEKIDTVYGFGYDSASDDYRVVMLVQFFKGKDQVCFQSEANVYSLGSNSWKKVLDFPNYRFVPKQLRCVLVSGKLHLFIMVDRESNFKFESDIASFDLVTEECKLITMPHFTKLGLYSLKITELGGCLSIVCTYLEVAVVSVWVMKEYGVTKSWTQLFTIGSEIISPREYFVPLAYSENGDEVLLMVNLVKLAWYNLEKKTIKVIDISGLPKSFYPVICLESLVSLGENAENDETQVGKKEGTKKKHKEKFLSVGFKLVL